VEDVLLISKYTLENQEGEVLVDGKKVIGKLFYQRLD